MKTARNVEQNYAIHTASFIIASLYSDSSPSLEEWLNDEETLKIAIEKWTKPDKKTLLHHYIEYQFIEVQNYTLSKHYPVEVINEIHALLNYYNIEYPSIEMNITDSLDFEYCDDELEKYAEDLQVFFCNNLLEDFSNDVFTVLYNDKNFLYDFNRICSDYIRNMQSVKHSEILKEDGVIKRITYIPAWLKKGIEYRDKCRCSICGCDLSHAFTILVDENFDHIIPLQNSGNNDPTNWQLTCESCNKSKGARNSDFKNIIFPFWIKLQNCFGMWK